MTQIEDPDFHRFLDPGANRFTVLLDILAARGLEPSTATLSGNRNIFVGPRRTSAAQQAETPQTVLVAHYDRVPGSPGANDNGASVFQLIDAAGKLRFSGIPRWLVVFTDKEEAASSQGIRSQGSYSLAQGFIGLGLKDCRFFIFDACGRGDTLIVSTTVDQLLRRESGPGAMPARLAIQGLRSKALETGRRLCMAKLLLVPTPFSDDAGFFSAGLAAQTITVLPESEAAILAGALRQNPERASSLIRQESPHSRVSTELQTFWPKTWSLLNGPTDTIEQLTPSAFPLVARFAQGLCTP